MEMEMRGKDDMEMGEDVTPSLPPLSFSLNDSLLSSHCSACFSPLPPLFLPPFPPTLLYCSSQCSNYDSALHHSSAESQLLDLLRSRPSIFPHSADSSDLRLALRLIIQSHSAARLAGLLTNRDKLTASFGFCDEILLRISEGARAMALARRMRDGLDFSSSEDEVSIEDVRLEESALCLVLTNAVEVQDNKTGRTLGVALYGQNFSWINHSCSPNACYRILLPSEIEASPFSPEETPLRIAPCCSGNEETQVIKSGVCSSDVLKKEFQVCYGPRMIVRSIKRIKKGEEVTVAYTDLLQPKAMRQSELWSRYRFICCCRRCNALPPTFVDRALEEISVVNVHSSCTSSDFDKDKATDMLNQYIDDAITDYLSLGDSQSCCEKLERVVTQGLFDEHLECKGTTPQPTYWMHPLHHLSLNAYTTLASAYKIRSNDLLASLSETNKNLYEAFDMSRTSAAYSLLLAGATNYLFQFEPSLIASAANFWASAGESLLDFARSSIWSEFFPASNLSSFTKYNCPKCSLREKVIQISISRHIKRETNLLRGQAQYSDFENISSQFLNCITNLTERAWLFLTRSCHHLKVFKDPIDFGWLATRRYVDLWDSPIHSSDTNVGSSTDTKEAISENEA
ncbi:protein SET DOMAIN GROUP 41 [Humulus lupulus]|uniref:protein SET DOMAIN GROUP 41 n=1 Tax=Humulus lupulus TaxID=3486 RepID=UPI002B400A9F|nr:protein SET DOMAIN GROUP 41 [Humulus lupulus]